MKGVSFLGYPRGGEEATPDVHAAGSTLSMIYFGLKRGLTTNKGVAGASKCGHWVSLHSLLCFLDIFLLAFSPLQRDAGRGRSTAFSPLHLKESYMHMCDTAAPVPSSSCKVFHLARQHSAN